MKQEALENLEEIPESEYARLYVVLMLKEELLIRSTDICMEDDWMAFGNTVVDWASVEMKWYLEDRRVSLEEQMQIITSLQADMFRIDLKESTLLPFSEKEYSNASEGDQIFAYLSTDADAEILEQALRARMQEVGLIKVPEIFTIQWRKV